MSFSRRLGQAQKPALASYTTAVIFTVAALLIRLSVEPLIGDRIPFATFFAAVALTAWFGSFGPCLLSIILGALFSLYFILEPRYTFVVHLPYQMLGLGTFIVTGLVIAGFSHRMRAAIAQSEARAREAEEGRRILQTLLSNVPEGITMALGPPDFPIVAVSRYALDAIGPAAESVIGMSAGEHIRFTAVLRRDRATAVPKEQVPIYRATHYGEAVLNEELVLRRHDGQYIDVQVNTVPIRDDEGRIIGGIGCWRDVTEQLRLVRQLSESEARFRAIFEQAALGMAEIGLDGRWLRVNQRLCEMTGYTREQLLALHSEAIIHSDDLETAAARRQSVLAGEIASYTLDTRYIRRDRSILWVSDTVTLVRQEGVAQHFIVVAQDVTQRKAAEQEIQRLTQTLEHRVAERTAELAAANQDLEAFSYSVSHDLRAPIRAIDGFSQILLEDYAPSLPSEARAHVARIHDSTRHMAQLVDDLLEFARLGRKPVKTKLVDLRPLVEQCIAELKHVHGEQCIESNIGSLPWCECDPALMRQVFANLLSNAFKFSRDAVQPKVEVASTRQDGQTVIYVRDNGIGFDMRYVEKLFGVFERLQRAEDYEGTGVGLAIVKRIIDRHGGRIWAEAEPGKGATFYFTLPTLQGS